MQFKGFIGFVSPLFSFLFKSKGWFFCRLLHAFQTPDLPLLTSPTRESRKCMAGHPVHLRVIFSRGGHHQTAKKVQMQMVWVFSVCINHNIRLYAKQNFHFMPPPLHPGRFCSTTRKEINSLGFYLSSFFSNKGKFRLGLFWINEKRGSDLKRRTFKTCPPSWSQT